MPIQEQPLPERRYRIGAIIHPPDANAKLKAKEYPMDTSPEIMSAVYALPPDAQQEVYKQVATKYPEEMAALPPEPPPTEEDLAAAQAEEARLAEEAAKAEKAAKDAEAAAKAELEAEIAEIMEAIARLEPTGSLPGLLATLEQEFGPKTKGKGAAKAAVKKANGDHEHEKNKKH